METANLKIVEILNDLISYLDDGKSGYVVAYENSNDEHFKSEFLSLSRERAILILQLQDEINKLGKFTNTTSGPIGALHRVWIDIKALITGHNEEGILNACITGETAAIQKFTDTLKNPLLNKALHYIISYQLAVIEKSHLKIELLKKTLHTGKFYE